jgi:acetoacetate decarboxylase
MAINYKADPNEVNKLLPYPYEPSADPVNAYAWFGDWLSVWEGGENLIYVNPERAQYKELMIGIRCRFKGIEGVRCAYIWVDKDFSLLRGWFYGYPKKLGRTEFSHAKSRLFDLNEGIGRFGPGTRLKAFTEAHGERIAEGTVKLIRRIEPKELPPPFGLSWYNLLHFPSTDVDNPKPLVHQIIQLITKPPTYGEVWAAEDVTLVFSESELEEHTAIKPVEIASAYFVNISLTFLGTRVVHQY